MLVGPGAVANAGLKSYPELKESGVSWLGKVPAHWEVRRLRNVAELRVSNVDKHTREGETLVRLCNYVDCDHAFVVDSGGYQALITWAETHGRTDAFGIEGTGSDGAGLARAVRRAGHRVVEVNRGDRRTRRAAGKSDTLDAEVAARSVLAGQSTGFCCDEYLRCHRLRDRHVAPR